MHLGKRFFRVIFETLVQIEIHQLPRRKGARPFGGKNICGKRLVGNSLVDILDTDRRSATGSDKKQRNRTK